MKIAFTPVVYEHAARFVGRSPWELSRNPELLYAGDRGACLEYRYQVIAVGIDIYNLEAEAGLDVAFRSRNASIAASTACWKSSADARTA